MKIFNKNFKLANFEYLKNTKSIFILILFSFCISDNLAQGVYWNERVTPLDHTWRSIAYGNGLFVAVSGTGDSVLTSLDGINWTTSKSATSNTWRSVIYGNGIFVAVSSSGSGNRVMTSSDRIIWTSRTSAADNQWYGVTFGNGLFVAVSSSGTGNRVMTSSDGIIWESRNWASDNDWTSVAFGDGLFVAVSSTGIGDRVMTSSDGIIWTSQASAADNTWNSITYGNGLFVAVSSSGTGNRVMTSEDGINWSLRVSAANNSWRSIIYGNNLFVAVSSSGTGNRVMTSSDGINWISRNSAANNEWYGLTFGNGLFVAVSISGTGNRVMTSSGNIWKGTFDSNWSNANNWSLNAIPEANDNILIENIGNYPEINQSCNSPAICKNLIIASNAKLTVNQKKALTVCENISNSGTFILKSNEMGTATLVNNGEIYGNGDFIVEPFLTGSGGLSPDGRGWYVSSPLSNSTSATFNAVSSNGLWSYSESDFNYTEITDNVTPLSVLQGYVVRLGKDSIYSFNQGVFNSGDIRNGNLTRTGFDNSKRGFHLIGNPYPSFLDWDAAIKTNISPTLWFRGYNGDQAYFDTYNADLGIGTDLITGVEVSSYIPPCQAFWIRVPEDGQVGQLAFSNSMRSHQPGNILKSESENKVIRLNITNGANRDQTIIAFNSSCGLGVNSWDSEKINNSSLDISQIYTMEESTKLVINCLPELTEEMTIPVYISAKQNTQYEITVQSFNFDESTMIYLEDLITGSFWNLKNGGYTFNSNLNLDTARFALHINTCQSLP